MRATGRLDPCSGLEGKGCTRWLRATYWGEGCTPVPHWAMRASRGAPPAPCRAAGEYALACEHAHSCCVLLARPDRFLKDGRWHTWIDYDRFQRLAASGQPFTSEGARLRRC